MLHVHVKSYDLIFKYTLIKKLNSRYQCYYKYTLYTKSIRKPVILQCHYLHIILCLTQLQRWQSYWLSLAMSVKRLLSNDIMPL